MELGEEGSFGVADSLDEALFRRGYGGDDSRVQALFERLRLRVQPLFHRFEVLLEFVVHQAPVLPGIPLNQPLNPIPLSPHP